MKTPRFSGPFKWSALRQQLLSLRDDVHTIRKIAGRNVTIDEHRGKGKVINASRDRGVTPSPTGCALPGGECPHAVCFDVQFDESDVSDQNLFDLTDSDDNSGWGMWKEVDGGNMTFFAFGWGYTDSISIPLDTEFHAISYQIYRTDATTGNVTWSVDGVTQSFDGTFNTVTEAATVDFGARNGSPGAHRTLRNIVVLANPDTDEVDFTSMSFDTFSGGASIVSGELRIDDDSGDAYALKNLDPVYLIDCIGACCSGEDCDEMTKTDCDSSGGRFVAGKTCDPNPCACGYAGGFLVHVTLTADINGTCDSGIGITTVTPQSFDDDLTIGSSTTIDEVTLCNVATNATAGRLHYVCGDTEDEMDYVIGFSIGVVTVAGNIDGDPFSVGDWVLGVSPFALYPLGGLGDCSPCTFSPTTYHIVLPDVSNTISISDSGVTAEVSLTFYYA